MNDYDPKILTAPSALTRCTHKDANGRQCDLAGVYHVIGILSSEPGDNMHMTVRFPSERRCAQAEHCPRDLGFFIKSEEAWGVASDSFTRAVKRKHGRHVAPVWDLCSVEYLMAEEEIDRLEIEWYMPPDPTAGAGAIITDLKDALAKEATDRRFEGGHGRAPIKRVHVRPMPLPSGSA